MQKTILLTGATDGIGLETAKLLTQAGHKLLVHGRSQAKLDTLVQSLSTIESAGEVEGYLADLSDLGAVKQLAAEVAEKHSKLNVLINNAGVFKTPSPLMADGQDIRFVVNTLAPYLLTKLLLPIMDNSGRVVNLSSAAQAPVSLSALQGQARLDDMGAYSQSKLAITQWSFNMAKQLQDNGPLVVAVNPGSLLASKMVKEGFGVAGSDLGIGADILYRAALSDEFSNASGQYYDNDAKCFNQPHPDALDAAKNAAVVEVIEAMIAV